MAGVRYTITNKRDSLLVPANNSAKQRERNVCRFEAAAWGRGALRDETSFSQAIKKPLSFHIWLGERELIFMLEFRCQIFIQLSWSSLTLRLSRTNNVKFSSNSWLALSGNVEINRKPYWVDKGKKLLCYRRLVKMTRVQVSSLCVFLNFTYSSKYFAQIYRAQFGAAMLVYLFGTTTWRPDNSINICDLLRQSRRLIICTEQTSMYIRAFPNTLTSE